MFKWLRKDSDVEQKAMPPISTPQSVGGFYSMGGEIDITPDYKVEKLAQAIERSPIMGECLEKITTAVSSPRWFVESDDKNAVKKFEKLLTRPNDFWTSAGFFEYIAASLTAYRSAFILKNDLELWVLPTNAVSIRKDKKGFIDAYVYKADGINETVYLAKDKKIIHIWKPSLSDGMMGGTKLLGAAAAHELYEGFLNRATASLKNAVNTTGLLHVPNGLSEEQRKELKKDLNDFATNGRKGGGIFVLTGENVKYEKLDSSLGDILNIELKDDAKRDIALAFGIPSQLLGIKGDNTYKNMGEARRMFWLDTILPRYIRPIEDALTNAFFPNGGGTVKADIDSVPAISDYRNNIAKSQVDLVKAGIITIDEAREALNYGKMNLKNGN